jgi:hypothetical protein
MNTENKSVSPGILPIDGVVPQTPGKDESAAPTEGKKSNLPLALREEEISEKDVEVLLRVARDKNAASGRYRRMAKRLPSTDTGGENRES